ncbi:hypothetical protein DPEC_G00148910 [Dallia pectoralis]|uniref:Uncharacterized protein n=1 Tax=Dallia pectoralis TaxID=75939 RepID=A0ACC2GIZ9_DALPE|nr:hypothetical protein DPEC_G00148910 [Dallia pectoralis]
MASRRGGIWTPLLNPFPTGLSGLDRYHRRGKERRVISRETSLIWPVRFSFASKTISKRKLRQTRSLDPALIRNCGTQMDGNSGGRLRSQSPPGLRVEDAGALLSPPASPGHHWVKPPLPCSSGPSTPLDLSPTTSDVCFDYDVTVRGGAKRNTAWDVPFLVRSTSVPSAGSGSTLFSPRRWLQKKLQQTSSRAYIVWRSEVG